MSRAVLLRDSGVEIGLVGGKDRYDFQEERMGRCNKVDGMPPRFSTSRAWPSISA
ncbi:MAG: hypothetical protein M3O70_23110 [Actinomycetota bacterium]|nr:hypothetical protein [Actinomycetota bacterium]